MWIVFALTASFLWGMTYVFNEQIYKNISIFTHLGLASFFVSILTIGISIKKGYLLKDLATLGNSKTTLLFFSCSVIALLLAEIFIGLSITSKNATVASLIEVSYPFFIILFSYLIFKNTISWQTSIGGLFIFAGVLIVFYFNK